MAKQRTEELRQKYIQNPPEGMTADEIRTMPFGTTPKMLKEIFENEKDSDFFTDLSKLLS